MILAALMRVPPRFTVTRIVLPSEATEIKYLPVGRLLPVAMYAVGQQEMSLALYFADLRGGDRHGLRRRLRFSGLAVIGIDPGLR